jgi:hypothetical protein
VDKRARLPGSTTSTLAGPFFRKAVFQLRDFGASAPSVSVRRYASFDRSRQPKMVTGATFAAVVLGSAESAVGADAGNGVVSAVEAVAFDATVVSSVSMRASLTRIRVMGFISRAAITITAPVTHIATTSIVPAPDDRFDDVAVFVLTVRADDDFFDAAGAFERVVFFTGIDQSSFAKGCERLFRAKEVPGRGLSEWGLIV